MTEHMRGPWHADMELIESDEGLVAKAFGRFGAEIEANARLIAAAPDLLAACETALDFLTTTGWSDAEDEDGEVGDIVRRAIAKARG